MKTICISILVLLLSYACPAQYSIEQIEIRPGVKGSYPISLTDYKGQLYFYAWTDDTGYHLFAIDSFSNISTIQRFPTEAPNTWTGSIRHSMAVAGDRLVFLGRDSLHGIEPYSYDGVHRPEIIKDILPGANNSAPMNLRAEKNGVYFTAYVDSNLTRQLFRFENNELTQFDRPEFSLINILAEFKMYKNRMYFLESELYAFDINAQSFFKVEGLNTGNGCQILSSTIVDDILYFMAYTPEYEIELYSFDGSILHKLTNLTPPTINVPRYIHESQVCGYGGKIFFPYLKDIGQNIWKNTLMYYDLQTGKTDELLAASFKNFELGDDMAVYNGKLFFAADTTKDSTGKEDMELWVYDGHTTSMLEIMPGPKGAYPRNFKVWNGSLYFSAIDTNFNSELYKLTELKKPGGFRISLYPNPTIDMASLDISLDDTDVLAVRVIDITGREVSVNRGIQYTGGVITVPLRLGNLSAGVYICCILNSKGKVIYSRKLVKI